MFKTLIGLTLGLSTIAFPINATNPKIETLMAGVKIFACEFKGQIEIVGVGRRAEGQPYSLTNPENAEVRVEDSTVLIIEGTDIIRIDQKVGVAAFGNNVDIANCKDVTRSIERMLIEAERGQH